MKGIPRNEKDWSDEVLEQVRKLFGETEVAIPDAMLDRAHRVSKSNHDLIVRFTTFATEHSIGSVKVWKVNLCI